MTSRQFSKTRHASNIRLNQEARDNNVRLICVAAIPRGEVGSYVRVMRNPGFYRDIKVVYRRYRKFFALNPIADMILGD